MQALRSSSRATQKSARRAARCSTWPITNSREPSGTRAMLGRLVVEYRGDEQARQMPVLQQCGAELVVVDGEALALGHRQLDCRLLRMRCQQLAHLLGIERDQRQVTDAGQQTTREGLVGLGPAHALTQAVCRDRHCQRARPEAGVVEGLARARSVLAEQREPEHELPHGVDPDHADRLGHRHDRPARTVGSSIGELDDASRQRGVCAHRVGDLVDSGPVAAAQLDHGERHAGGRRQLAGGLELVEAWIGAQHRWRLGGEERAGDRLVPRR